MVPTPRLAWFALLAMVVGTIGGYASSVRPAMLAIDGALLAGLLVDVAFALGRRVDVDRQVAAIFSVGRPNLVTLQLRNRSGRTLRGAIADDPLEACEADGNPGTFEIGPYGTATVRYEV